MVCIRIDDALTDFSLSTLPIIRLIMSQNHGLSLNGVLIRLTTVACFYELYSDTTSK